MIACLRLFTALCLAALLAACANSPSSSLGELPRTPDASIEQLLEKAASSKSAEDAALLRLSAADLAYKQKDFPRAARILEQVPLDTPAGAASVRQHLGAELAMSRNQPKAALTALAHPSLQRVAELPEEQQARTYSVHAAALEADGQALAAAQQRVLLTRCSAARPPAPTMTPSGHWSPRYRQSNCSSLATTRPWPAGPAWHSR